MSTKGAHPPFPHIQTHTLSNWCRSARHMLKGLYRGCFQTRCKCFWEETEEQQKHVRICRQKFNVPSAATVSNALLRCLSHSFLSLLILSFSFFFQSRPLSHTHTNTQRSIMSSAAVSPGQAVWGWYDEEGEREDKGGRRGKRRSRRRGSKSWGSPPLELDSITPVVESFLCTHGNMCACKHTLKRLCIVFPVSPYYCLCVEVTVCCREVCVGGYFLTRCVWSHTHIYLVLLIDKHTAEEIWIKGGRLWEMSTSEWWDFPNWVFNLR